MERNKGIVSIALFNTFVQDQTDTENTNIYKKTRGLKKLKIKMDLFEIQDTLSKEAHLLNIKLFDLTVVLLSVIPDFVVIKTGLLYLRHSNRITLTAIFNI